MVLKIDAVVAYAGQTEFALEKIEIAGTRYRWVLDAEGQS